MLNAIAVGQIIMIKMMMMMMMMMMTMMMDAPDQFGWKASSGTI